MNDKRALVGLLAAAALVVACGDDDDNGGPSYTEDGLLTVETRNLYLGADLSAAIAATTPAAFVTETTGVWTDVSNNDFHRRAEALADEIASKGPEVIGLQEVYLWRRQETSDVVTGTLAPNATTVVYDYLADLTSALSARGMTYNVVGTPLELFDFEAPIITGPTTFADVRLTDRQVILARGDVTTANPRSGVFTGLLPVTVQGNTVTVKRGWTAADVTFNGQTVTVVNTHLESFDPTPRLAQAAELVTILNGITGRAVLVGDLNSLPGTEGHAAVVDAGFTDVWATLNPTADGFTCCWPEALNLTTPGLSERIDYVLTKGALTAQTAEIVGDELGDRRSGLWPSDHAGLVVGISVQ